MTGISGSSDPASLSHKTRDEWYPLRMEPSANVSGSLRALTSPASGLSIEEAAFPKTLFWR